MEINQVNMEPWGEAFEKASSDTGHWVRGFQVQNVMVVAIASAFKFFQGLTAL